MCETASLVASEGLTVSLGMASEGLILSLSGCMDTLLHGLSYWELFGVSYSSVGGGGVGHTAASWNVIWVYWPWYIV